MRKGQNPTYHQKTLLEKNGYDWTEWLIVKTEQTQYTFRHKSDKDKVIVLDRNDD